MKCNVYAYRYMVDIDIRLIHLQTICPLEILPDLENHEVKSAAYPADRAVLLWRIGALIEVIGMREDFLRVFESDATLRVCPKPLTFLCVKLKSHVTGITVIP